MNKVQCRLSFEAGSLYAFRYPEPYKAPVIEVKLMIRINQADRESMAIVRSPAIAPALIVIAKICPDKLRAAIKLVIITFRNTTKTARFALNRKGTKYKLRIPIKEIANE